MLSATDTFALSANRHSARAQAVSVLAAWCCGAVLVACTPGAHRDEEALSSAAQQATAPDWLLSIEGSGTWTDPADDEHDYDVLHGWVDARVKNLRYHKRVLVEVLAPYESTATMRTLHPASYRAQLDDGYERWGADSIEIFADGGPGDTTLAGPVLARARLQHDLDDDGEDEMLVTDWNILHGDGDPIAPAEDPWAPGLDSPAHPVASPSDPAIFFAPFDDPGAATLAEIHAIIARQKESPQERHTLHAAVFNITDPEITDALVEAHQAGVEVRLLCDGRKFRPWYDWYQGDDRLLLAGVPLLGVRRDGNGAMHDKIALFDGRAVVTGSGNWEWGARFENHENVMLTEHADVVPAYARRFEVLAGGVQRPRAFAADPASDVSVSFAPDEEPHRIVGQLVDQAQSSLYLAMFTAKDVVYREGAEDTSLLAKLVAAHDRGVDVRVIVDHGIHEAAEYHGIETEDDPTDEWLESQGVHVVRADNSFGPYASMHHKFVVIDGRVLVTGAFNWYHDAAFLNDEDQLVWRDQGLARRYTGEFVDLLRRYDDAFQGDDWPVAQIYVEAFHDQTAWGDTVLLVGELEQAGVWNPALGVELDPAAWPIWRATLELPMGVRMAYKLVVRDAAGEVHWEQGRDRLLTAPTDGSETVRISFRH